MEDTYNLKAIILNRKSYAENDCRVIVYSRESGKLELVARGAKKIKSKLAGHLEPFNLSDIMAVRGQKYDYAGTAVSEKCYVQIKTDLVKLAAGGRGLKIFSQLIKPGLVDVEIFELLKVYLETLDAVKSDFSAQDRSLPGRQAGASGGEILTSLFIFKLLACLGHKPELVRCLGCVAKLSPGQNRFDLARGGLVCGQCADPKDLNQLTISDDAIKLLRLALKCDLNQLIKVKISKKLGAEASGVIDKFYRYSFN